MDANIVIVIFIVIVLGVNGALDRLLSVLDRAVNDDSKQEGECEHVLSAVKIKVPPRTHQPNRKNLSANAIFEKCRYIANVIDTTTILNA